MKKPAKRRMIWGKESSLSFDSISWDRWASRSLILRENSFINPASLLGIFPDEDIENF